MAWRGSAVVILGLLSAVFALAGCTESTTTAVVAGTVPPAKPAEFAEGTGGIEGLVIDDENNLIAGVQLGLQGTEALTESDSDGKFSFSNVLPGEHVILASRLGYEPGTANVVVVEGEVAAIDVVIVPIASIEPFSVLLSAEGIFGCGLSWRPAVVYSGVSACGLLGEVPTDTSQYDQFLLVWDLDKPTEQWMGNVFEMEWSSTQAAGKGLRFIWEINGCANVGDVRFGDANGVSPLRLNESGEHVQEVLDGKSCGSDECGKESCRVMSRVFSDIGTLGTAAPADVGVTLQQPFTQYLSAFYNEEPPVGFTAVPPA
jgi:carboxypeptidase family protein